MHAKSGEVVWLCCVNSNFLVSVTYANYTLYHHGGKRDEGGTGHPSVLVSQLL